MDIWGDVLERNCHSSEWLGHHRSGHRKRKKLSFTETLLSLQASLCLDLLSFSLQLLSLPLCVQLVSWEVRGPFLVGREGLSSPCKPQRTGLKGFRRTEQSVRSRNKAGWEMGPERGDARKKRGWHALLQGAMPCVGEEEGERSLAFRLSVLLCGRSPWGGF